MKKLALLVLLVCTSSLLLAQPQEIFSSSTPSSLVLINDGEIKILVSDYLDGANHFTLYNLDSTVYRVVSLPAGDTISSMTQISYVSTTLFDCDESTVEYVYFRPGSGGVFSPVVPPHTRLVAEDGSIIMDMPGYSLYEGNTNFLSGNTKNIVDDEDGAVMCLFEGMYGHNPRKYYRLCGHLPQMSMRVAGELVGIDQYNGDVKDAMRIYPNPVSELLSIDYNLPAGHQQASMRIFTMDGMLVKQQIVTHTSEHITIDVHNLPSGTYMLNVLLDNGKSISEKFVKIKRQ